MYVFLRLLKMLRMIVINMQKEYSILVKVVFLKKIIETITFQDI